VTKPGDNAWSRRFRDVFYEILSDVAGPGELSEGQRQLARRCATLSITCEKLECDAAAGMPIDFEEYGKLTDRLGRALSRLRGIRRHSPRDVTPPLDAYLARIRAQDEAVQAAEPQAADDDA
jgi:hypothetical protein